jgi:transcriptional regulator with XRE-family HTH domain
MRKLTWAQVCEIRRAPERQLPLAERYGVSRSAISRIQRGVTWPDADDVDDELDGDDVDDELDGDDGWSA